MDFRAIIITELTCRNWTRNRLAEEMHREYDMAKMTVTRYLNGEYITGDNLVLILAHLELELVVKHSQNARENDYD